MSSANLVGFLVLGLAVVGLAAFEFTRPEVPTVEAGFASAAEAPRGGGYDRDIDSLNRRLEAQQVAIEDLQKKIRSLEDALAARPAASPVAAAAGEGEVAVPAVSYPASLEEQVSAILDKREEEERKAQTKRRVEGMARFFLRDVQVTDQQRSQFVDVLAAYWDERGNLMRKDYATSEDRQAAVEGLTSDRNVKLQRIFDAAQYSQISERLDRMNRGFGGRGGRRGNRGR